MKERMLSCQITSSPERDDLYAELTVNDEMWGEVVLDRVSGQALLTVFRADCAVLFSAELDSVLDLLSTTRTRLQELNGAL